MGEGRGKMKYLAENYDEEFEDLDEDDE